MKNFEEEYQRLNSEQQEAVDTVEGPVMVVAGPGTGKTQVLAMRVARILQKTQAKPSNILCLTFSTSGATAMRERLRHLLGAEAYGVTVSTIHGFANDIISSHPIVFDDWSAHEQISDIERYRTMKRIIDSMLPNVSLVNRKNPYIRIKDILSRFSDLKREGVVDSVRLHSIAEEYTATLAKKSKEGTKAHEKNLLTARKFTDLVRMFLAYEQSLLDSGRYDYDDMLLTVNAALHEHDWLLAELQERYQYILVDEFQDTNGAQYEMIEHLVTPKTVDDVPNIFVVGDDDQAIYRFQGANLQNILKFHHRFQSAKIIVLQTSYRCSQKILDAADALISHNTERLTERIPHLTKKLQAGVHYRNEPAPTLLRCPSEVAEPWMIAECIEEKIQAGVLPQDIAILTQTNKELRPIYDVLQAKGIPVQLSGKLDLLQHPLVSQVIALFQAGMSPESSALLSSALGAACLQCHPADLGRLFDAAPRSTSLLSYLLLFGDPAGTPNPVSLFRPESVIAARDFILELHQGISSRTIVETFEFLLKKSGILPTDTFSLDPLDYAAIQALFDTVKYRAYEQPSFTAQSFADDLLYYLEPEYGDIRLTYDAPHLTDEGVALMTAHRSKGLEFDVVFLPSFREKHWDQRQRPSPVSMPEDLLFGWSSEQKKYESQQDERRVAFVAMTRARKELYFTCARQFSRTDKTSAISPSGFFAEAGDLPEAERELMHPERIGTLLFTPVRHIDQEFASFLRKKLQTFSLSVTALNHFLEDPKLFLESDLLQVPQAKNSSLVYGNAVHDALKKWALAVQSGQVPSSIQFVEHFAEYLATREVLTEKEQVSLLSLGRESLPRYFSQKLEGSIPSILKIECPIQAQLGDIPLKGKIDRIDALQPGSSDVRVIDFKTGRPKTELEIRSEDYFRQLVFYALLLEKGMPYFVPREFVLDFIGEGEHHAVERVFSVTSDEKKLLEQVIGDVWKKVQALDFTPL